MVRSAETRAANAAMTGDLAALTALVRADQAPRVRAVAVARITRIAPRRAAAPVWRVAATDPAPEVRRRAAEVAPALGASVSCRALVDLLADDNPWVAEAAAFALGEHPRPTATAGAALIAAATTHPDPLVREAAVAALGAQGDPASLPAVLHACDDKPAIRRRAVLALAAFEGPEVEARLRLALDDKDWQVRQAAETLLTGQPA